MLIASTFKKQFVFLLLPFYVLVSFLSVLTVSEEQNPTVGFSTGLSQNVNLEHSPQNFSPNSLNISKPVNFYPPGIQQKFNNRLFNEIAAFNLSLIKQKGQFTAPGSLYIFNRVLRH